MDNQNRELWQGGPWEQNSPTVPPLPRIVLPFPYRPVLRPRRRRRWPIVLFLALLIAGLGLLAVVLHSFTAPDRDSLLDRPPAVQRQEDDQPPNIPQAPTGTGVTMTLLPDSGVPLSYTQIYEKNAPSIVSIESIRDNSRNTGTGVVLTGDGYLITNAHVVASAEQVQVSFFDNRTLTASLVGFDAEEDLAVLKVAADDLIPAEFGDSAALRRGDPVAAIGDPLGYRSTITDGIVSALDREVRVKGSTMLLIQTSAAINFGNSGGALINQYGQVVGITTVKIITNDGSAEALGFAIPSQRVKYVADSLIDGQAIRPGVFGFTVNTRRHADGGLELISVHPNSDAFQKGLRPGDVILSANGQPIACTQDLSRLKLSMGEGDPVAVTYLRDGVSHQVELLLVDPALVKEGTEP